MNNLDKWYHIDFHVDSITDLHIVFHAQGDFDYTYCKIEHCHDEDGELFDCGQLKHEVQSKIESEMQDHVKRATEVDCGS